VRMISTIHDATIVNKERKDVKANVEIKKPYAVVQSSKFVRDIGQTSTSVVIQF